MTGQLFSPRALWAIDSSKNPLPDGTYVLEVANGKVIGWTAESGGGGGGITGLTSADATVDIADNGDGTLDLSAPGGGGDPKTAVYKFAGSLAIGTGQTRLYNDTGVTWTLLSVRASVETAPTGGTVTVDVNKNGTTVFTTQANRPAITSTNTTSGKVTSIDVTSVPDGDYLTVDIDGIASPAANLTVTIAYNA